MTGTTLYHVKLGEDEHAYFGSVAAIYERFSPEDLGVRSPAYGRLASRLSVRTATRNARFIVAY